jgi:hypothetical protein
MNGVSRWKVVLLVVATFVVGAVTGGFLTLNSARLEVQEHSDPRRFFTIIPARFAEDLSLTTEQEQKIRSIFHEIGEELNHLRVLDLRETDGILSRGEDRITPLLNPDQREKMHKIFERRKQRVREWLGVEDEQKRNHH